MSAFNAPVANASVANAPVEDANRIKRLYKRTFLYFCIKDLTNSTLEIQLLKDKNFIVYLMKKIQEQIDFNDCDTFDIVAFTQFLTRMITPKGFDDFYCMITELLISLSEYKECERILKILVKDKISDSFKELLKDIIKKVLERDNEYDENYANYDEKYRLINFPNCYYDKIRLIPYCDEEETIYPAY
jgi:hypothetical protein